MKKYFVLIFCFGLILSCSKNEKEKDLEKIKVSKAFLLTPFQDSKVRYSLNRFPIVSEIDFSKEQINQLNLLLENKNNFDDFSKGCFEPELGIRIILPNQTSKSILVSLECARLYIYDNNKKSELSLSQLGIDKFKLFLHLIFSQDEIEKAQKNWH